MSDLERPELESVWRHHSGRLYRVKAYTNLDTTRPEKYPVTIVYQGENGKLWSRPLEDWHRSMEPTALPARDEHWCLRCGHEKHNGRICGQEDTNWTCHCKGEGDATKST